MSSAPARVTSAQVVAARPAKNPVDPWRPHAFLVESERTAAGAIEDVATLFLTNRECPFRCVMCDLWRNTTDERVPLGAIPAQIDYALERLPPARHIKLYNAGNFFDAAAIPPEDHGAIAERVRGFATVIVENHPKLCTDACLRFRDRLDAEFEIALGLETVHPQALAALNKQMTLDDFSRAAEFLTANGIAVRAFILLRPPLVGANESVHWALESVKYAFDVGARCCAVIPTRGGNGIMERLAASGNFAPPTLANLEAVLAAGIELGRGRVFVDLWDIEKLVTCSHCGPARADRLRQMNLSQQVLPSIDCACGGSHA